MLDHHHVQSQRGRRGPYGEVGCVLLSEGVRPDEALLARAADNGVNLLGSEKSTFDLAALVSGLLR